MSDLHGRAVKVFGISNGFVQWPYGLADNVKGHDGVSQTVKQHIVVEWAERNGLKASHGNVCCPLWLLRETSRGCSSDQCMSKRHRAWLDHRTGWLKDGKPTVLTSAPYADRFEHEEGKILELLHDEPKLGLVHPLGWYGHGTVQVVLWNRDRLESIDPWME